MSSVTVRTGDNRAALPRSPPLAEGGSPCPLLVTNYSAAPALVLSGDDVWSVPPGEAAGFEFHENRWRAISPDSDTSKK